MNDNDIIKALEIRVGELCEVCACEDEDRGAVCASGCTFYWVKAILNLINRQKAEIADLKSKKEICAEVIARQENEIDKLSKVVDNYESCLKCVEVIKANAIKEFAERLKNKFYSYYEGVGENTSKSKYNGETLMYYEVADMIENCIDNTVKELTEEQNEK